MDHDGNGLGLRGARRIRRRFLDEDEAPAVRGDVESPATDQARRELHLEERPGRAERSLTIPLRHLMRA